MAALEGGLSTLLGSPLKKHDFLIVAEWANGTKPSSIRYAGGQGASRGPPAL